MQYFIWDGTASARSVKGSPISEYVIICQENNTFSPTSSLSPFPFTVCSGSSSKLSHRNNQNYSHSSLWLPHMGRVQCQPEKLVLQIPGQTSLTGGRNTLCPHCPASLLQLPPSWAFSAWNKMSDLSQLNADDALIYSFDFDSNEWLPIP